MKRHVVNAKILIGNQFNEKASFLIEDGRFVEVSENGISSGSSLNEIDLEDNFVVPGLIDLQLYGVEGYFFGGEPTVENLRGMEEDLLSHGVTGFLATIATSTDDIVLRAIEAAKEFRATSKGAFLGLHLEGPFLNPKRKGAHPDKLIRKATLEEVKHWLELAEGEIKMMTIAPELQDEDVLTLLQESGVVLSVGHSNASFEEAQGFLTKTVTAATHLFNAMTPLHHREPGLVASVFEKKPFSSIIPDGIHVDYAMVRLAKRELGDRLFIITDRVASSKSGIYQHQFKGDHYETPEGILSGSSLYLLQAVMNCVEFADIPVGEAFAMAGEYPARAMGLENVRGKIAVGNSADFLVLDKEFRIKEVWFKGEKVVSYQ